MHEFGLCESILDAVEQRAGGRPVTRVTVRCGVLNRVDGPTMQQVFTLVAEGSVAEAAALDLVVVPVRLSCNGCGQAGEVDDMVAQCPTCESLDVALSGGDELRLVSVAIRNSAMI